MKDTNMKGSIADNAIRNAICKVTVEAEMHFGDEEDIEALFNGLVAETEEDLDGLDYDEYIRSLYDEAYEDFSFLDMMDDQ